MQSVGIMLWKMKTDWLRSCRCSVILPLSILAFMLISILPALGSEAFATDPAARTTNGSVTAVASAQVVKPYITTSLVQSGINASDSAITVSRRTPFRDCKILLGATANQASETSCELRLIELQ
jgi:hypothetical protein